MSRLCTTNVIILAWKGVGFEYGVMKETGKISVYRKANMTAIPCPSTMFHSNTTWQT
jgi:hypothetical protein